MQPDQQEEHRYGGSWTEIKLNAVVDYLKFYTGALRNKPFDTWYVDAFAGTGERTIETSPGTLFQPEGGLNRARLDGSARRAIAVDPPFRHLVFIEKHAGRFAALEKLKRDHPDRNIDCVRGDANMEIKRVFSEGPWIDPDRRRFQRAVVFLDPYGMSVRWDTLKFLADTGRADIWYLFPLHAALRQLSHDHSAMDQIKRTSLAEVFGSPDWENEFYQAPSSSANLFDFEDFQAPERIATSERVEQFAAGRLKEIFCFVSQPIPILTRRRLRQFSLFLLSGNPSPQAKSLIHKGVTAQIKKYGRRL